MTNRGPERLNDLKKRHSDVVMNLECLFFTDVCVMFLGKQHSASDGLVWTAIDLSSLFLCHVVCLQIACETSGKQMLEYSGTYFHFVTLIQQRPPGVIRRPGETQARQSKPKRAFVGMICPGGGSLTCQKEINPDVRRHDAFSHVVYMRAGIVCRGRTSPSASLHRVCWHNRAPRSTPD